MVPVMGRYFNNKIPVSFVLFTNIKRQSHFVMTTTSHTERLKSFLVYVLFPLLNQNIIKSNIPI